MNTNASEENKDEYSGHHIGDSEERIDQGTGQKSSNDGPVTERSVPISD